jgi:CheY-like chemotaxis protein
MQVLSAERSSPETLAESDAGQGRAMREEDLKHAQILIVDDEIVNTRLLERTLQRAGFTRIRATTDPREVLSLYRELQPDLVLLDLHMPYLDGFAVMEQLKKEVQQEAYLPFLVLTADIAPEAKEKALRVGAKDFLTKPFDVTEVLLRIMNLLETRFLYLHLENQNQILEERVRERTRNLEAAQQQLLDAEAEKKRFYREVIRAVTRDKLQLVDTDEVPTVGSPTFEVSLEDAAAYALLRNRIQEIAEGAGMNTEHASDLVLATGEAVTNAIKHGVEGRCAVYAVTDHVTVRVSDRGPGIRAESLPASVLIPGYSTAVSLGMGHTLMLQLVDRVWLATGPDGTVVQLESWVHPEAHQETVDLLERW